MIDYEKLKQAIEIADKYLKNENDTGSLYLTLNRASDKFPITFAFLGLKYLTIDDLITKLKELTQPEPKYKFGDTVWSLKKRGEQGLMSGFIDDSDGDKDKYYVLYDGEGAYWQTEDDLYPSRNLLIDAQIDYWYNLKMEAVKDSLSKCVPTFEGEIKGFSSLADKEWKHELTKCDHECSAEMILINPGQYKCVKCGVFYR